MDNRLTPYVEKMGKTLSNLEEEIKTIRAGRANPAVLNKVRVDYYGSQVPVSQVGNITVPEARILQIAPWEPNMIKEIVKAINIADSGINPNTDGKVIRLIFPELTEERRKELTKEAVETLPELKDEAGICLLTDMKEGLIGLVANRLMNEYNLPTIVFTNDGDKSILKGSIRSKEGFNVTKAFESLNKYLLTGGGHALAGGLSIKAEDFDSFKKDFLELCKKYTIQEEKIETIDISLSEVNQATYKILESFSPFGMGFREPVFLIKDLPTRALTFISQGKHLSTKLSISTKLLGFNMSEGEIKAKPYISIYGTFNISEYKGFESLEFRISKYE